eukprot:1090205-Pyramimonas_sp.AAC.1
MGWAFGAASIETDVNEFDVAVQTRERHGSAVPSDAKAAILIAGMQDRDLQEWLMVNADRLGDCDGIAKRVQIYLANRAISRGAARGAAAGPTAAGDSGPTPMAVGSLAATLAG